MKKIIFLFFLVQVSFTAVAQEYKYHVVKQGETTAEVARQYKISENTLFKYNPDARAGISPGSKLVVPISGGEQEFEMHRVRRKETLFSLSQQYNVSIEEIKKYNKHLYSEELRRGERIRIPVRREEPEQPAPASNPLDITAKEHVVLPQETYYGISRKYNITIADLQRLNPHVEQLKPGMVLKVRNGNTEKVIDVDGKLFKYYQVKPQETLFSLTRRFGISKDSLISLNPALADGLKSGMVLKIPNLDAIKGTAGDYTEDDFVQLENQLSNFSTKNIALMLPFSLGKIQVTDSTTNAAERLRKDRVLQIALDFYSGVLMAVDSAKTLGISTNLSVYDTEQDPAKVYRLLQTKNFSTTDAVIGPLLQSTIEAAASGLEQQNVPVISPLTKKQAGSMDNFVQARPTDEMLSEAMISYISDHAAGKNIVVIADPSAQGKRNRLLAAFPGARTVNPTEGGYVNQQELRNALIQGRPNFVILESSKIGVLSNATSYLNSLADRYNITLFTTEKNNSFESDNVSNRHLAQLKLHYPSVEKVYSPERDKTFIEKYKKQYEVVPNSYAVRGFDVAFDVLLRLATAQDFYSSVEKAQATQYVENKFDYRKRSTGGYQNQAVYIMAYDKDLHLKVVR